MILFRLLYNFIVLFFFSSNRILLFSRFLNSVLEGMNFVGRNCIIYNTKIGKGTYLGNNCEFSNCEIGRFCSISRNIHIIQGDHPTSVYVSTSPLFFSKKHMAFKKTYVSEQKYDENKTINGRAAIIGNDVWIGANVDILAGVTIGNGAIVGANSLVTKSVPAYAVVGGVPAKIIKYRFPKEVCDRIEETQWWNWDDDKLQAKADYFTDYQSFLENI